MIVFAHSQWWYIAVPLLAVVFLVKWFLGRAVTYNSPLVAHMSLAVRKQTSLRSWLQGMRGLLLSTLVVLLGRPQVVDECGKIPVEGIDIVLVLDISGSMGLIDDEFDQRTRCQIAKEEAMRFVSKRTDDAMGLVIFGNEVVSRCPLTFDRLLLQRIISEVEIGVVNADGTMLARAIVTAANRLKDSHASSKVMILLTDGTPSQGDLDPKIALDVAKKLGIRIYTVGIGSQGDEMVMHPLYGIVQKTGVNSQLLTAIAHATEGRFFMARDAADMRRIYDTIDALEKSKKEAPVYTKTHEWYIPFALGALMLVVSEFFCSTLLWFVL
jgi:Ca-activated chloride channel homolog